MSKLWKVMLLIAGAVTLLALGIGAGLWASHAANPLSDSRMSITRADSAGMMERHMADIPSEYAGLHNPIPLTDESLKRGQELYVARCAACHGEEGDGDGVAAQTLDPPPAVLAHTGQMLTDAYLFWRISEGGSFEPFDSAMPAFASSLSNHERWDVIHYLRSLAGTNTTRMDGVNGMDPYMMQTMMRGGGFWMIFGGLASAAALAGFIALLVWAFSGSSQPGRPTETPVEILKRRYAAGEINGEQFETMKRQLAE